MSRRYRRRNPLSDYSDTALVVGGLLACGIVGAIAYFATRSTTVTQTTAGLPTDPTSTQLGLPSGISQANAASYLNGQTDAYGNPIST